MLCWFLLEDVKWTKKLSSYFSNFNFEVSHEPWICVNPLHMANPHSLNKMVSLQNLLLHIVALFYESCWFIYIIFWSVCHFIDFSFVLQTIEFVALLHVWSLSNTYGLKHVPLHFQMNMNKDLSETYMDLDCDVLYNFVNATSQLMKYDGVTSCRGPRKKKPLFFQVLIDALSKHEGIVAYLTASIYLNQIVFILILF